MAQAALKNKKGNEDGIGLTDTCLVHPVFVSAWAFLCSFNFCMQPDASKRDFFTLSLVLPQELFYHFLML